MNEQLFKVWNHILDLNERQSRMLELIEVLTKKIIKMEHPQQGGLDNELLNLINKYGIERVQESFIKVI